MKNKILIADDEESIRWVLGTSLEKSGYSIDYGSDGKEALEKALSNNYSLILLDIIMPTLTGLEVLNKLKEKKVETPVILITAQNTVKNAISGTKLGAYDYIAKPFDLEQVNKLVNKAVENFRQLKRTKTKKKTFENDGEKLKLGEIVGKSPDMLKIYKTVGRIADKDITVLITGESGTGKELITRAIHFNSHRNKNKLVSINIAAIPKELLESELFGYEKGAFTGAQISKIGRFEEANNGTLHIDEIGDMSADLQAKLLRVLEEKKLYRLGSETPKEIDVRIVATTNKNLKEETEKGNFREDIFYRLNAITVDIPPLRNRKEDIPVLIDFFINKYCDELGLEEKVFSDEVIEKFGNYFWPGNVRELENTIKRIIVLSPDKLINIEHIKDEAQQIISGDIKTDSLDQKVRDIIDKLLASVDDSSKEVYSDIINKIERQLFEIILDKTKGNKKKAASILGINRNTLAKKLSELELN